VTLFIIILGALICLAGLAIQVNPESVFGFIRSRSDGIGLHILAVVMRLVLGVFLVIEADVSKYPHVIGFLGWLSICAAVILVVIGRKKFRRLMTWALSKVNTIGRPAGLLASVLGAFLVYAFI
jgi:hypothetical protein